MPTLALSKIFMSEYAALEASVQRKALETVVAFGQMTVAELYASKGLHLEKYGSSQKDPRARTIRITDNYRGIVMAPEGDQAPFLLVHVLKHDEADHWMMNNVFHVNAATGAFEMVDVGAIKAFQESMGTASQEVEAAPLFEHRKAKEFTQLGIEGSLVPVLTALTTEEQLDGLCKALPESQAFVLQMLLDPETAVEEIWDAVAGDMPSDEPIDTEDVAAALERPVSQSMFYVMQGEEELHQMLAQPLDQWRVYLHPSQRAAAYKDVYNGPARVTGGAGTGKTVVAIHRARHLADRLSDRSGKPILFTTFTVNLAEAIEADLKKLAGPDILDVVEVLNVDKLAWRLMTGAEGQAPRLAGANEQDELWREVCDELGAAQPPAFMAQEWQHVVLAQAIEKRDDYLTASRAGRGVRLDRRQRMQVWRAIESFTNLLAQRGARTYLQMAEAAAGYVAGQSVKPFRHVIVDEAQDLHESQWRMLRACVAEGPNDLFLVGDSHQRIYDNRSSLSRVGINIRGRSRKLRINYRTTEEILRWSLAVLGQGSFDDLDDGKDSAAGYQSFLNGPRPTTAGFPSKTEELDGLVDRIEGWLEAGVAAEDIGVAARTQASLKDAAQRLEKRGKAAVMLGQDLPSPADVGIRLGTMHRMKGMEYRCVAVIDADAKTLPLPVAVTPAHDDKVQHDADVQRERCLLYVACSRARDDLWIGWAGKPSVFLEGGAG